MDQPIIEIKGIGKKYDINHMRGGYVALRDVIGNAFKNPFSFLAKKARSAVGLEKKEEFWALKNVSFNVKRGEVVGVIGANGAGKSTLLKILSQITPPTEGEAIIRGRVGSLLEVGTGFHPELTGRENIFLNGAILGMKRTEIASKFDQIVEFAGVKQFLDTPVKHYSSGMYVRLAFSVAAHMDPDILLIDEVLAVGDAEFQKKCLGKMDEITRKDGRTILFVSHNIAAIQTLCTRVILLKNGTVADSGSTQKVIATYNNIIAEQAKNLGAVSLKNRLRRTSGEIQFHEAQGIKGGKECWDFDFGEDVTFKFKAEANKDIDGLVFAMALKHSFSGETISNVTAVVTERRISSGEIMSFSITIPKKTIRPGQYSLYFALGNKEANAFYDVIDNNANLPLLNIQQTEANPFESGGFISIPYKIKLND